jgi:hypothetical protein
MHETALVARALELGLPPGRSDAATGAVRLTIRDPLRAEPDSVAYLASALLRLRGDREPTVVVEVADRACDACGETGRPSPTSPTCPACGLPLRPLPGPAIVAALLGDGG